MSNLRFVLVAIALFAGAFVGVSWASKGFPVVGMRSDVATPGPSAATMKQPGKPVHTSAHPAELERDHLAQTAIQAAGDYTRAPCDMAAKAAFIVAASTYLRSKAAASGASAPLDVGAHQAIKAAIETGGVGRDEFPPGTEISGATFPVSGVRCINSAGLQP